LNIDLSIAYRIEAWQLLFSTLANATAALVGLLFIALSLNLRTIIKVPLHTARAREAVAGMLGLLFISVLMLIPGQGRLVLGSEMIVGSLIFLGLGVWLRANTLSKVPRREWTGLILRHVLVNLGMVALLIAGISLIAERGGGLYWLVPTILLNLATSLYNAWILMVRAIEGQSDGSSES
jgi:hypothetical protein